MESDLADNHVVSSGVEMNHGFISNYDISPGDGSASVDAYRDEDGRYFAVAPDENPDGEPKFPINNCSDVGDAWQLRNHGDIGISVETLEERIKRRASDLDCEDPEGESDSADDCGCDDDTITIERTLHIHD